LQNNLYHTGNQQEKFLPPSNFSRNQAPINIKGRRKGCGSGAARTGFSHQNPDKTTSVRALPCRLSLLHAPKKPHGGPPPSSYSRAPEPSWRA
jgi:hypothetical protein